MNQPMDVYEQGIEPVAAQPHKARLVVIFLLVVSGLLGYVLGISRVFSSPLPIQKVSEKQQTDQAIGSPAAEDKSTFSASPDIDTQSWPSFDDEELGITFRYPVGWKVTSETKDQVADKNPAKLHYFSPSSYTKHLTIVDAEKKWELHMFFSPLHSQKCEEGGQGPALTTDYTSFPLLNQTVSRLKLEEGKFYAVPEGWTGNIQPLFFGVPIEFKDSQGQYSKFFYDFEKPVYQPKSNFQFCSSFGQGLTQYHGFDLQLNYYSPEFTEENLTNKKIDVSALQSLDAIVKSLHIYTKAQIPN